METRLCADAAPEAFESLQSFPFARSARAPAAHDDLRLPRER
jgi:hypothetical protein